MSIATAIPQSFERVQRDARAWTPDLDVDLQSEIRVEQSVHLVAQSPTLVIGNCLGALIAFLFTFEYLPPPLRFMWMWIVVLTIPMAWHWIKLRRKSRPVRVSPRRIRAAAWYSLVLGLSWALLTLVAVSRVPPINQVCLMMGTVCLCAGAVASVSALPYSSLAYFLPQITMALVVSFLHGQLTYRPVAVLSALMLVALFSFLRQNWNTFRRNVEVAVERTRLAELQSREVARRVAIENELRTARQVAEDASRAKSMFLANMSHELRTPLNAVIGYTELLADGVYGELSEQARSAVDRIGANGQHLLGLINDILDLSKIEAGQLTLRIDAYSWQAIADAVVAATQSLASAKAIELRARCDAQLPLGRGDESRLRQVLLNLAGNAIKFTDRGSVEIGVTTGDDAFEITVADTGPGIAEADQARIFEEFQQGDASSTRTKGGTGLGLAISRRIVALHGGSLGVRSVPGQGATFIARVPIDASTRAEAS